MMSDELKTMDDPEAKLREEGFRRIYTWEDGPDVHYPDHTHPVLTAHIVLAGEMTVTTEGQSRVFRAGDRFDVPAYSIHSATMGPAGCRYLIGEK